MRLMIMSSVQLLQRNPNPSDQEIRHALHISDYVYVLELGRNKFEGPASDFDDLEKAFWVA